MENKMSRTEIMLRKVLKKINSRYTFLGYVGFANMIEKI